MNPLEEKFQRHIRLVAAAGRLRISEERAVALFHAAAVGIVVTFVRLGQHERGMALSSMARHNTPSVIAITSDDSASPSQISLAATTLAAAITMEDGFSQGE